MFGWLREYLEIRNESKVCLSCETLKQQLEIANYEKERLFNKLLETPEPVTKTEPGPPVMTRPKMINWRVRQQMLEAEDREKARIMREVPKPDPVVEELEKELGVK